MSTITSVADVVYQRIKKQIFSKKLLLGQKVLDTDLAEEFKVSKTPVREAFLRLRSEGLIEIHPRSGTFIFRFSQEDLLSLVQARTCVEEGALRCAYAADPVRLVVALEKSVSLAEHYLDKGDFSQYLSMDKDFHAIILTHSKNIYLEKYYTIIFDKITILRSYLSLTKDFIATSVKAHRIIAEHIANDRIDEACARLHLHIANTFNDNFLQFLNEAAKKRA
ncbi:GntR family transcriptional regulator [Desulfovibrio sp. 86]|uniref:HTH gntR-type domain-containing protein n=1 Tax=uncultured Desulfovibrio sp. TaxID=167968 RepID=A0A212L654_9BACT|nr:GntR family transcriptional regulator [Desulfovibrio sp. 86]SCM73054.1 hypothetical protein KL86DES1_21002 [uncultured Desulfovibrio sp.]VZH33903.1 conserved protein of unknown function [Desulfovibrio sp. 86]